MNIVHLKCFVPANWRKNQAKKTKVIKEIVTHKSASKSINTLNDSIAFFCCCTHTRTWREKSVHADVTSVFIFDCIVFHLRMLFRFRSISHSFTLRLSRFISILFRSIFRVRNIVYSMKTNEYRIRKRLNIVQTPDHVSFFAFRF